MTRYLPLLKRRAAKAGVPSNLSLASTSDSSLLSLSRAELMARRKPEGISTSEFEAARQRLIDAAPAALERLDADQSELGLTPPQRMSLEAIVLSDGTRNAFYIQDDSLDLDSDALRLGPWEQRARDAINSIEDAARSVGRVDIVHLGKNHPAGTCFAIADNLVATNRHVLEGIAKNSDGAWGKWRPLYDKSVITFKGEKDAPGTDDFEITEVVFAGPDEIGLVSSAAKLDLAILKVAPISGNPFPAPLLFDASGAASGGKIKTGNRVYVLGFPISPKDEDAQDLAVVFGGIYGVKQWSPGKVIVEPGTAEDAKQWMFAHDASTLPGSSGSLIVDFEDIAMPTGVGLHFAGERKVENNAHVMAKLQEFLAPRGAIFV